jgi:hypothetical protein
MSIRVSCTILCQLCINSIRFIRAPHSWGSLRISFDMLCFLFTYFDVMPAFLDFVFLFGKQINRRELHSSGFRESSQLAFDIQQPVFRLCYTLRSVEHTTFHTAFPGLFDNARYIIHSNCMTES